MQNIDDINDAAFASITQTICDVPGSSYQDKLNHLSNCFCCQRHQVNKPMVTWPFAEPISSRTHEIINDCSCNCRHVARMICRRAQVSPSIDNVNNNTPISSPSSPSSPSSIIDL